MSLGIKEIFGVLSVVLGIGNMAFYILTIIRGKTKPHLFTWLIWTITNGVIFLAQYMNNAGPGAWVTGIAAISCILVAVMSLFRGERTITRTDWIAFVSAIAALIIWLATKNPLGAVILLTCVDSFGFYPTYRKSFHTPYNESVVWTTSAAFVFGLSIAALTSYSLVNLIYPAAMVILHFGLGLMLIYRRKVVGRKTENG